MKKYVALVLLISFVGLLWAQEDTCLKTENVTTDIDEECADEQIDDVHEEKSGTLNQQTYSGDSLIILNNYDDLLLYVPEANFIYTQEYFASDQDTTDAPGCLNLKWYQYACCIGVGVGILVVVAVWWIYHEMYQHMYPE